MTTDEAKQLGKYLQLARRAKKLSTRALAAASGVDMATVVRLEQGSFSAPKAGTLTAIAQALDIPLADVFAAANYVVPTELPTFAHYLRAKYGQLPEDAVRDMERYFTSLVRKYGFEPDGPPPGGDEQ